MFLSFILNFQIFLNMISIQNLSYQNTEIKKLRSELKQNLRLWHKKKAINIKWRKYIIQKKDNFFSIMAKTMQDHDTLSSVNRLSSLWDINLKESWLIPNMRGIAVYGDKAKLSQKYSIDQKKIEKIPGKKNLYFIPGSKFSPHERKYLDLRIFIRPVSGRISSGYGFRKDPFSNKKKFHKGIDIACKMNSKVRASADGKIIFKGYLPSYGKVIIIQHLNGYQTLYGHLKKIIHHKKTFVKQGELIAYSGNSGISTGPHLHFEVRRKGKNYRPRFKRHSL